MSGVSRLQYPSEIRLIRVMCSGRVDLEYILRAFSNGQDGVFIGGCRLNECNYITHGNYDALGNTLLFRKIMEHLGLNPERLSIEFMSGGDGNLLVDIIRKFTEKIKVIGPIGKAEEIEANNLKAMLEAVGKLIPYLKLVERERLRVSSKSEKAYNDLFASEETDKLFNELIADKLVISRILSLLGEKPLSTGEISTILNLDPSEVSKHIKNSSKHGLVRYDSDQKRYTPV